jgi:hypothetical protein
MILDRPPKDWKRPATLTKTKLQVLLNQDGKCKATGERLGDVANTHFDHRPALWERKFDTATRDTVPPANDPAFIEAITRAAHDQRTHGPGGEKRITTRGSDSGNRAKDRAVIANQTAHTAVMAAKATGEPPPAPKKRKAKIPGGRPLPKGRRFQSRAPA